MKTLLFLCLILFTLAPATGNTQELPDLTSGNFGTYFGPPQIKKGYKHVPSYQLEAKLSLLETELGMETDPHVIRDIEYEISVLEAQIQNARRTEKILLKGTNAQRCFQMAKDSYDITKYGFQNYDALRSMSMNALKSGNNALQHLSNKSAGQLFPDDDGIRRNIASLYVGMPQVSRNMEHYTEKAQDNLKGMAKARSVRLMYDAKGTGFNKFVGLLSAEYNGRF